MSNIHPLFNKILDQYRTEEKEVICGECQHCKGEIYEYEEVYLVEDGSIIHEDCFNEYAREVLLPVTYRLEGRCG